MPSRGAPDGSPPKLLAREADAAYSQSVEEAEPALSFPHRQNNGLKFLDAIADPRCSRHWRNSTCRLSHQQAAWKRITRTAWSVCWILQ